MANLVRRVLGGLSKFALPTVTSGRVLPLLSSGRELPGPLDFGRLAEDGYRRNAIIYACVRAISRSAAEPELKALTTLADGTVVVNRSPDPLTMLLQKPNPNQDQYDFFERLLVHLHIAGNAFIHKVRSRTGNVVQLELIRPDLVGIIPGKDREEGLIAAYTVRVESNQFRIPAKDMIHVTLPDALDEFWGLSPLFVLARYGDIDIQAAEFLRAFFLNRGIPSGLLTFDKPVQKPERERVRDLWREQFQGLEGWHNIAVLDASVQYQAIATRVQEMDLGAVTSQTETRICAAFGIPPVLIGSQFALERSSMTNLAESRNMFWVDTLTPLFARISRKLTARLAAEDFGDNRSVMFDLSMVSALQENKAEMRKVALQGWNTSLLTRGQANKLLGLPTDPGQENVIKVLPGTTFAEIDEVMEMVEDAEEADEAMESEEDSPSVLPTQQQFSLEVSNMIAECFPEERHQVEIPEFEFIHQVADSFVEPWADTLRRQLAAMAAGAQRSAIELALEENDLAAFVALMQIQANTLRTEITQLTTMLTLRLAGTIGKAVDANFDFDFASPKARASIAAVAEDFVEGFARQHVEAMTQIAQAVMDGRAGITDRVGAVLRAIGLTSAQVSALITLETKLFSGGVTADEASTALDRAATMSRERRIETIAKTETITAAAATQLEVWRQLRDAGVVRDEQIRRFWLVTPDDRLDQKICALVPALNPEGRGLEEAFTTPIGALMHPAAHPRCRCSVVLLLRDQDGNLPRRPGFTVDGVPDGLTEEGQSNLDSFLTGGANG